MRPLIQARERNDLTRSSMIDSQNQRTCCGCGIKPPPSASGDSETTTLLSTRFGWRVVRRSGASGEAGVEWRCPACWEDYRAKRFASMHAPPRRI
jgi:hypothetical protein